MFISTVLLLRLDDRVAWCWAMGCFIWWRKHSCLCLGFCQCLCSWCFCDPQAARSFQQILQFDWFPCRVMTDATSSWGQPFWTLLSTSAWTRSGPGVSFQRDDGFADLRKYRILMGSTWTSSILNSFIFSPLWELYPSVIRHLYRKDIHTYNEKYNAVLSMWSSLDSSIFLEPYLSSSCIAPLFSCWSGFGHFIACLFVWDGHEWAFLRRPPKLWGYLGQGAV